MKGQPLMKMEIRLEYDVVETRQRSRQLASLLGFDVHDQTRIATAVSEIARNAFRYGQSARVEFSLIGVEAPQSFRIVIQDQGPGISDLQAVMQGRCKSSTGMGLGILGAKALMDEFSISSSAEGGTIVVLGKHLPHKAPFVRPEEVLQQMEKLLRQTPDNPLQELQQQNQELLQALEEVNHQREEVSQLNKELEDTSRGVVALYAELDEKAANLQRANEVKTRFLSNMTHEFRTPLNSVLSLSRLLLEQVDGPLNPEQAKQVSFILKSTEDLSDLVNDLLDLAKVESGKITVRPHEFRVADLFAVLRGMFKPLLAANTSVQLIFEEPIGIPPLFTDEDKVSQILRNFISNALKYTETGEVRVRARIGSENKVTLEVVDTGIGIAKEDQERVFDEFVQVETPLQKRSHGTGLGLPLTRRLAGILGGSVMLESRPGVGSTFSVILPIHYQGPEEVLYVPSPPRKLDSPRASILLIDDDEISRYLLKGILPVAQFRILEARTGVEGIRLARDEVPAVIFLDLMMPEMNGFEVLQRLKSDLQTSSIPIIIHSSKLLSEKERDVLKDQVKGFFPKGLNLSRDAMARRLNELFAEAGVKLGVDLSPPALKESS